MSDQSVRFQPADIAASVYEYSRPSRNPVAWILVGIIASFAFYGLSMGATQLFWVCLALFAVVNLWVVWGKTTHGLRMDGEMLTISPARDPIVISLYLIDSIRYITHGERRLVEISCRNGRVRNLDTVHFPRPQTLATLLEPHKIDVIWD